MKWRVVKPGRAGDFGDYEVRGIWYENDAEDRAWHITAALRTGNWNDGYWVAGGEFFRVDWQFGTYSYDSEFQILEPITDVDPEAKKAVLEAIEKWESEAVNSVYSGCT
jgi:hypothetical protein